MPTRSPLARLFGLGFAIALLPGCSLFDLNPSDCDDYVEAPSDDFPRWAEVGDANAPRIDFQVCDSATVDLNGDGRLDLVAANHLEAGFAYFMGEPTGPVRFAEGRSVEFVGGGNSAGVVVADFNMDGIPDIANSDHPGILTVRVNATPAGAAIDEVDFPDAGETNIDIGVDHSAGHGFAGVEGGLVAADFNADGKIDIATANLGENADGLTTASVFLNTTVAAEPAGDGERVRIVPATFAAVQYIELPGAAISIATADFDGDGSPDLVTSNTAVSSVSVLTNRTPVGSDVVVFEENELQIPADGNPAGAGPTNPVVADFNGDGKPDVATANWNVQTVVVFTNATDEGGPTAFIGRPEVVELCFNPLVVRAADLDGDDDDDLVVIPLDLREDLAFGVIENQTEPDDEAPSLAFVDAVELPARMRDVGF
ncbi:MAG TPA: VCBS repeat-containing protein, partial [Nannocystaceae bacterium]|nr:VCBS repeat-containing protein [Nannocystaceae bacterium]